jgi:hypothetical protein
MSITLCMRMQMNEAFIDQRSLLQPIPVPHELLQHMQQHLSGSASSTATQQQGQGQQGRQGQRHDAGGEPAAAGGSDGAGGATAEPRTPSTNTSPVLSWRRVYMGTSAASICSGMSAQQLYYFYHSAAMCIRSYDPHTGSASLRLPSYLAPPLTPAPAAVV